MTKIRLVILGLFILIGGAYSTFGQTGQVCISQEAANKCSELVDKNKALQDALTVRDDAIAQLKIELAQATQKNADQEAALIRLTVLFDTLLKNCTKPKKFGLINF